MQNKSPAEIRMFSRNCQSFYQHIEFRAQIEMRQWISYDLYFLRKFLAF